MANLKRRRAENAAGDFFVDDTCIDCGTCMWMEPAVFHDAGGMSAVHTQPTASNRRAALRAVISCPTASIGVSEPATRAELKETISDFPVELADGVHHCGFHAESSFGATSYFIRREDGNVLVDSPRFAAPLVKRIKDLGGVRWMFLTHQDDVADHAKWAAEFGCERIIHEGDARALNAEIVLHGNAEHVLAPGLTIIPTPGHTRGSACLHYNDRFLFTGDHMAYSRRLEHLYAFKSACWYDWGKLVKSLHRLAPLRFEWVLPGHGWPLQASAREMEVHMQACLKWAEG